MKVLFAAGEALPYVKTGGLADVVRALPAALTQLGVDLRVILPAYRGALERAPSPQRIARIALRGYTFAIWETAPDADGLRYWLVDCPPLYAREGTPYADADGREFADNAWRFGCFCEVIAGLALGQDGTEWVPDLVHLNDWHTGLVPVWLRDAPRRPRLVFSIHNLAYQGVYGRAEFDALGLPASLWHPEGIEFYGDFSFMKAGLLYGDALTTVSPTYAREIQTPENGERLDGVLRVRAQALTGIANGIDTSVWNPATDPHLAQRYDARTVQEGKRANKAALQDRMALEHSESAPLIGFVGRLAHQKGADLLLQAADALEQMGAQLVLLGAGDSGLERAFRELAERNPGRIAVRLGYDEALAHQIEAGADIFVMPSRYEPCGLNQMYSQRYGTIPVVRRTGGLADTVVDATPENIAAGRASGVWFNDADVGGVTYGLRRALELRSQPETWHALRQTGMGRDFGWDAAAKRYLQLYRTNLSF